MSTQLQPLTANRDTTLDLLRGFAMAGVLFMFCVNDIGTASGYNYTLLDQIVDWPKWILVENRMYSLLIIIFGYGFGIQLSKALTQGKPFVPVYLRRCIGLIIIGTIHALLLSKRDILLAYGLAGIALLPLIKLSNRQLVFVILLLSVFVLTPLGVMTSPRAWANIRGLVQPNEYRDYLKYNWQYFQYVHQAYNIYLDMFFHFVVGFYFSRIKLLSKIKTGRAFRNTIFFVALLFGVKSGLIQFGWIEPYGWDAVASMHGWKKFFATSGLFTNGYIFRMSTLCIYTCLLIMIGNSVKGKMRMSALIAFGQMAMSNYLIQSMVLVPYLLLFDKYHDIPPFQGIFYFLVVFVLQLFFSKWWMSKFNLGPFEWLLRSFTYWKWQSIKKNEPNKFDHEKHLITT